jgi:NitT/TauT family transport system substrate-binding protein
MVAAVEIMNRANSSFLFVSFVTFVSFVPIALATCGGRKDPGLRSVKIAIGGQNQMVYLPTTLAQELGFYHDEGIEAELQDFAGGAKSLQALVGGSADVVSGLRPHDPDGGRRAEIVAFVTMLRFPGLVLVTSPQSAGALTTIADLKGRIAGVTTAGSSSQMLLTYMLQRNGLAPDAVSITAIGSAATAIAALEHGKVDVGMVADPAFTLVRRRNPGVRVLADLRTANGVNAALGTHAYPASVLYAKGDWIRANRDTTERLARVITRTLSRMQTHTPQEIADKTPKVFRGEDEVLYVEALKSSMPMFSPDGLMAAEGAEAVRTLLASSMDKVRAATIDVSKTYTNEFIHGR